MNDELETQNSGNDEVLEEILNRTIAPYFTADGVDIPEDSGILVLAEDDAGEIAVPFIIPSADKVDVIIDIFSRATGSDSEADPEVAPEVMVSSALPDCIKDFYTARDNNDNEAWHNLTSSVVTLLLGLHIRSVEKDKVVTGFSDSQRDNTLPVLYGLAQEGMLTTGLVYIDRGPGKALH